MWRLFRHIVRGCIPSKAIIHAADRFDSLRKHSTEEWHMGLSVSGEPEVNMSALVSWKDAIVERLNKGVEGLLKSAGAELIHGWANFVDAKTCKVKTNDGEIRIEAEKI